jgi:hypothetical protein
MSAGRGHRNPLSGPAVVLAAMAKLDTAAVATLLREILLREIAQRMELAGGNLDGWMIIDDESRH